MSRHRGSARDPRWRSRDRGVYDLGIQLATAVPRTAALNLTKMLEGELESWMLRDPAEGALDGEIEIEDEEKRRPAVACVLPDDPAARDDRGVDQIGQASD